MNLWDAADFQCLPIQPVQAAAILLKGMNSPLAGVPFNLLLTPTPTPPPAPRCNTYSTHAHMHAQGDGEVSLSAKKKRKKRKKREEVSSFHLLGDRLAFLLGSAAGRGAGRHRGGLRGGRQRRPGLDASTFHVRQQLVGNLCQDILGQSGHAQNLIPRPVDVVSERNKLFEKRHKWRVGMCFKMVFMSYIFTLCRSQVKQIQFIYF